MTKPNTHGGYRKGSGRKGGEPTVSTGFRVHKESLEICRANKVPLNSMVNELVKTAAASYPKQAKQ